MSHSVGWLRQKDRQHQMFAGMWSNWNSHTLLLGVYNDVTTLENCLSISFKVKYIPTSNSTSKDLSKRNKNICAHENLH